MVESRADLLATADQEARSAYLTRAGHWMPLFLFGLISLAATPLYRPSSRSGPYTLETFGGSVGGSLSHPNALAIYWLVAGPVGIIATVLYYRRRGRRRGIEGKVFASAALGIGLFALLALTSPEIVRVLHLPSFLTAWRLPGLFVRGLTPLLVIALGLVVLALLERQGSLLWIAPSFLGLAVLVNLYDLENIVVRVGIHTNWGWAINILVTGLFLVIVGVGLRLSGER